MSYDPDQVRAVEEQLLRLRAAAIAAGHPERHRVLVNPDVTHLEDVNALALVGIENDEPPAAEPAVFGAWRHGRELRVVLRLDQLRLLELRFTNGDALEQLERRTAILAHLRDRRGHHRARRH